MSIFDKWDKNVDTEGLQKDIAEAEANGGQGDYREVPVGTYEVKIDSLSQKDGRLDRSTSSLEVLMSMTQWNSKHMVSTMT